MSFIRVPLKKFKNDNWGDLSSFGLTHEIVGEKVFKADENFSFIGGHRVRLFKFKKNVHFKVLPGVVVLDISEVTPAQAARPR